MDSEVLNNDMTAFVENLIGNHIEQYCRSRWNHCATVVSVCEICSSNQKMHMECNEKHLGQGYFIVTNKKLVKSKWSKHMVEGLR